ncbi:hypothetical protein BO78DRAFT_450869 [Aspergillus sclerotiicarbonarius CBS 121057]|uniref:Uncharacterized protein n=1 Tax=Aspergillus sclerotiicarbonarius (strain CBS 121057 / IBT 28362) TaxID=1448318 RepID=A0A319EJR5_ASPSB|nr:hypothetical protein BO78DRAFT_450869 [Aspergillus sclerotiicarbonarius CBS 121057]
MTNHDLTRNPLPTCPEPINAQPPTYCTTRKGKGWGRMKRGLSGPLLLLLPHHMQKRMDGKIRSRVDRYDGMNRVLVALSVVGVLVAVGMAQRVCLEECFDMEQPCPYGERSTNVNGCWSCCRPVDEE